MPMNATIELGQINTLPTNTLAILKDNFEPTEFFSLVVKDTFENITDLHFKTCFLTVNEIPFCVLMVKIKDKLYKCPISFELARESDYLQKIFNLNFFNLYLVSENKKIDIIKIKNKNYKTLSESIEEVKKYSTYHPYCDIICAKQKILSDYSDEKLWNM